MVDGWDVNVDELLATSDRVPILPVNSATDTSRCRVARARRVSSTRESGVSWKDRTDRINARDIPVIRTIVYKLLAV